MNVKELIDYLNRFPDNSEVNFAENHHKYSINFIMQDNTVNLRKFTPLQEEYNKLVDYRNANITRLIIFTLFLFTISCSPWLWWSSPVVLVLAAFLWIGLCFLICHDSNTLKNHGGKNKIK